MKKIVCVDFRVRVRFHGKPSRGLLTNLAVGIANCLDNSQQGIYALPQVEGHYVSVMRTAKFTRKKLGQP